MLIIPGLMLKKSQAKVAMEACGKEQDLLAAMRNGNVHTQPFRRYL